MGESSRDMELGPFAGVIRGVASNDDQWVVTVQVDDGAWWALRCTGVRSVTDYCEEGERIVRVEADAVDGRLVLWGEEGEWLARVVADHRTIEPLTTHQVATADPEEAPKVDEWRVGAAEYEVQEYAEVVGLEPVPGGNGMSLMLSRMLEPDDDDEEMGLGGLCLSLDGVPVYQALRRLEFDGERLMLWLTPEAAEELEVAEQLCYRIPTSMDSAVFLRGTHKLASSAQVPTKGLPRLEPWWTDPDVTPQVWDELEYCLDDDWVDRIESADSEAWPALLEAMTQEASLPPQYVVALLEGLTEVDSSIAVHRVECAAALLVESSRPPHLVVQAVKHALQLVALAPLGNDADHRQTLLAAAAMFEGRLVLASAIEDEEGGQWHGLCESCGRPFELKATSGRVESVPASLRAILGHWEDLELGAWLGGLCDARCAGCNALLVADLHGDGDSVETEAQSR